MIVEHHCPVTVCDFVPGSQVFAFVRAVLHKCRLYSLFGGSSRKVCFISLPYIHLFIHRVLFPYLTFLVIYLYSFSSVMLFITFRFLLFKILDRSIRRYLNSPRAIELPLGMFTQHLNLKGKFMIIG